LQERARIQATVGKLVGDLVLPDEAEDTIRESFSDLGDEDASVIVDNILEVLRGITPDNSVAWRVDERAAEAYREVADGGKPAPRP
jgi:hypothetical protein